MASTFPSRCFTCGKVLKWEPYAEKIEDGTSPADALDEMKMRRMCCRRMYLSHIPQLEETMLMYPPREKMKNGKIEY